MNEEEKEKLLEALRTIRSFCMKQWNSDRDCGNCPMRDIHGCYVMNSIPESWEIKIKAEDDWRAFCD